MIDVALIRSSASQSRMCLTTLDLHFLILHHFFVFYLLLSYFILLSVLTWDSCSLSDWIFFILFHLTSSDFTLLCSLLVSLSVSVPVSTVCGEKIGVELKADGELYVNQRNFNFCQGAKWYHTMLCYVCSVLYNFVFSSSIHLSFCLSLLISTLQTNPFQSIIFYPKVL